MAVRSVDVQSSYNVKARDWFYFLLVNGPFKRTWAMKNESSETLATAENKCQPFLQLGGYNPLLGGVDYLLYIFLYVPSMLNIELKKLEAGRMEISVLVCIWQLFPD
jgi:hypothetical protein